MTCNHPLSSPSINPKHGTPQSAFYSSICALFHHAFLSHMQLQRRVLHPDENLLLQCWGLTPWERTAGRSLWCHTLLTRKCKPYNGTSELDRFGSWAGQLFRLLESEWMASLEQHIPHDTSINIHVPKWLLLGPLIILHTHTRINTHISTPCPFKRVFTNVLHAGWQVWTDSQKQMGVHWQHCYGRVHRYEDIEQQSTSSNSSS